MSEGNAQNATNTQTHTHMNMQNRRKHTKDYYNIPIGMYSPLLNVVEGDYFMRSKMSNEEEKEEHTAPQH